MRGPHAISNLTEDIRLIVACGWHQRRENRRYKLEDGKRKDGSNEGHERVGRGHHTGPVKHFRLVMRKTFIHAVKL
jgi:hypothetical protein